MDGLRLTQQMDFIVEIDKMKRILRKSRIIGGLRYENDAEHTWHLAIMAVVLQEYANSDSMKLQNVLKMLLIHDIVEIDAGDTFAYDETGYLDKAEREGKAAERIFGLLPKDTGAEFMALWQEFEARETPEARYANALDRLQPMLLNSRNRGQSWRENHVAAVQVRKRAAWIEDGAEELFRFAAGLIQDAVDRGYISENGEHSENGMKIRPLATDEPMPYDLLYLADPSKERVERSLETGMCYVYELDGNIAGEFILSQPDNGSVEITNIAVREDYQRQGIGKALLQSAIRLAKDQECRVLRIATGNSSIGPLTLYQRIGFRIAAVEPDYFAQAGEETIIENGIPCLDRIVLSMNLA